MGHVHIDKLSNFWDWRLNERLKVLASVGKARKRSRQLRRQCDQCGKIGLLFTITFGTLLAEYLFDAWDDFNYSNVYCRFFRSDLPTCTLSTYGRNALKQFCIKQSFCIHAFQSLNYGIELPIWTRRRKFHLYLFEWVPTQGKDSDSQRYFLLPTVIHFVGQMLD